MLYADFVAWCASVRSELEAIHPIAPWLILSVISCIVYVPRFAMPKLWARLPPGHRLDTIPAAIFGAAWATITTGQGDPWLAVQGAVAAIVVPLVVHYRRRLIEAEGAGGGAVVLALCLTSAAPLQGCGARPPAHYVETGAALAYSSSVVALELLDAIEAQRLSALESPSDAELEAAEVRVRRLELARDALALVRSYLTDGRATDDVRRPLRDAVGLLRQAAETEGARVPPRAAEAIRIAEAWLGGDGES